MSFLKNIKIGHMISLFLLVIGVFFNEPLFITLGLILGLLSVFYNKSSELVEIKKRLEKIEQKIEKNNETNKKE